MPRVEPSTFPAPQGHPLTARHDDATRDVLVIGSGFGGALAAHALVTAGWRVTLVERGPWVPRSEESWLPDAVGGLGPYFARSPGWSISRGRDPKPVGTYFCVGGPSVFYGGVSLRFRAEDFEPLPEIDGSSGAAWPFDYAELEPWYGEAERLIGVAGTAGADPTEPPRSTPYSAAPLPMAAISDRIAAAARGLGMHPFPLPLAIHAGGQAGRQACIRCNTCDGFACGVDAKNSLDTAVIRPLLAQGLDLRTGTAITRLETTGRRVTAAIGIDTTTGAAVRFATPHVVLAAGALATPHLLLASGLDAASPAGDAIGRYLTRHKNEILLGIFARQPDPGHTFHKQLGIHDLYFGQPGTPYRRIGGLQQLPTPPVALARDGLPRGLKPLSRFVHHLTGLLVIAEDQPQHHNRVHLGSASGPLGMPTLGIEHRYSERDLAVTGLLRQAARRVLRRAGALACYRHTIDTFSHALGTVRTGRDPATSPLDAELRFRGLDNLLVTDGSALPRSAAVNPSLTIAAMALRAGRRLAARHPIAVAAGATHG